MKINEYSRAFKIFHSINERCQNLVKLFTSLQKLPDVEFIHSDKKTVLGDIIRSSAVLSVAAMDAYFTDVFCEHLVPYLKIHGPTPKLATILEDAGLDTKQSLELLTMQRPFVRIRKLVEHHIDRQVTQNFNAVDKLFAAYGIGNFTDQVQHRLHRKTIKTNIRHLVNRRHQIVHEGDLDSYAKLRSVDAKDLIKRIKNTYLFVMAADELLRDKLRSAAAPNQRIQPREQLVKPLARQAKEKDL